MMAEGKSAQDEEKTKQSENNCTCTILQIVNCWNAIIIINNNVTISSQPVKAAHAHLNRMILWLFIMLCVALLEENSFVAALQEEQRNYMTILIVFE